MDSRLAILEYWHEAFAALRDDNLCDPSLIPDFVSWFALTPKEQSEALLAIVSDAETTQAGQMFACHLACEHLAWLKAKDRLRKAAEGCRGR